MNDAWYALDIQPLWILVSIAAGILFAFLLYSKKNTPWTKNLNILLGALRFSAIFLIVLLLINPMLKATIQETYAPVVVLALDNTESVIMRESAPEASEIESFAKTAVDQLGGKYDFHIETISDQVGDSISFDGKKTNLSKFLKRLEQKYADTNLGAVILATDGIVNEGLSPTYQNYTFPIYSIGLGDTLVPRDIYIQNVRYNEVVYQDNQFPIKVEVLQKGFTGANLEVTIKKQGSAAKTSTKSLVNGLNTFDFLIVAEKSGLMRLDINIAQKDGEVSYENNTRTIYVEVVEGKEKVLILAPAPHPDISAIRSVLNNSKNYESVVYIPGLYDRPSESKYDVIIEHQSHSGTNYGSFESAGYWFILGKKSELRRFNQAEPYINIKYRGSQTDEVTPAWNSNFQKFKLEDGFAKKIEEYSPLDVPFGDYIITGNSEVLLYQRIGSVITERPLWLFAEDGSTKKAVLMGSNFWQWRLQEAAIYDNAEAFSALVIKTIQYLSIQDSKERFRVKSRAKSYTTDQRVIIETEVYNEIFERKYDNQIILKITDEQNKTTQYEIIDSPINSNFNLGNLEPGIYTYSASTQVSGERMTKRGSFVIKDIQLEGVNTNADHNMLKILSENNDGQFYDFTRSQELLDDLLKENYKGLIKSKVKSLELISVFWVIGLIFLLLTTEWFLRKYLGSY